MIRRTDLTAQTIGTAAFTAVTLGSGTLVNQDSARFGVSGGAANRLTTKKAGRYGFYGKVRWDPVFVGLTHLLVDAGGVWTYWPTVSYTGPTDLDDVNQVVEIYVESDIPGGTTEFGLEVRQESGANQTLDAAMFQITYLGDFTNMSTAYDDF